MKTTLTKNDHLQLVGLLTLAQNHNSKMVDIQKSVNELVGDEDNDHVSDAVWGSNEFDAKELLKRLQIKTKTK